ncbi:MAG: class I SAM-dependent RNA methyltransferase [Proteobacteria bacterium]|nr:class I SAM-dependent RNA methyltransferase [Pseudomonadota bacterium]
MPITRLTIQKLGPLADGITETPQGTVYVDRALPDDELRVSIYQDKDGKTRGDITEILKESPHRQLASCSHYDVCGNCSLQHLKQSTYQSWKQEIVKEAFQKVGLTPSTWKAPLFIGKGNRRRVTFTLKKQNGKTSMGYFRRRSHEVSEIESCEIIHPELLDLKNWFRPFLGPLLHEGDSVDVFLQKVGKSIDVVLSPSLEISSKRISAWEPLLTNLLDSGPVDRLSVKTQTELRTLFSERPIETSFGPLKVELPPAAFLQPTQEGERGLVETVMDSLPKTGHFADLFSGCGTFAGPLLSRGSVHAFEVSSMAISALKKASKNFPLQAFQRDLFKNPLTANELSKFDALVFDPPRSGCIEQAKEMAKSSCPVIVGVSCNPASLAKDARILVNGGYRIEAVRVIDQFLFSHHVEVVITFTKSR